MAVMFNHVEVNSIINSGYAAQVISTSGGTTYIGYAHPQALHTEAKWTCCKIVDNGAGLVTKKWTAPGQTIGADGANFASLTYV